MQRSTTVAPYATPGARLECQRRHRPPGRLRRALIAGSLALAPVGWPSGAAFPPAAAGTAVPAAAATEAEAGTRAPHPGGRHRWVSAWGQAVRDIAPSPWLANPTPPGAPTAANATYRFIVTPDLGGDAIRLRFSNPEGEDVTFARLTVGAVAVGGTEPTPRLVPGTVRALRFRGERSVVLPTGASALSDPLHLEVRRGQPLAVSVHVPEPVKPSSHTQTYVTQYVTLPGIGDRTSEESGSSFLSRQEPIHWLDDLRVRRQGGHSIVLIGDSITDGELGPPYHDDEGMDRVVSWPQHLRERLQRHAVRGVSVINAGVNGDNAPGVARRLGPDVLQRRGVSLAVVEIGTNDLTGGSSAGTIVRELRGIARELRSRGIRVIGATLVPRAELAYNTAAASRERVLVNRWIRRSPVFDGVLDIARVVGEGRHFDHMQARYDAGDGLHPNIAGYKAIAASFPLRELRR